MQCGVQRRYRIDDRGTTPDVSWRSHDRSGAQTIACDDLAGAEFRSSDTNAGRVSDSAVWRKSHLDRPAW